MNDVRRNGVIVAGTDTGIGKTVLSALLVVALEGEYWKPIQSGLDDETDTEAVIRMSEILPVRAHDEGYRLRLPLSPDQSAESDGIVIERARLEPPKPDRPLVIELAGGLLVPVSGSMLQIDLLPSMSRAVILAARSGLGTLNHTLLSVEALERRRVPCVGIVMIGAENPGNRESLLRWSPLPIVGSIPPLESITAATLRAVYRKHFTPIDDWTIHRWT